MARTKELTVEEKLKYLYELQQVDSKIDNLRTLAGELPQEVKDMADEVEGLKTRLANIENDIKECETQISDHRVRTENANASISRYKEQQNSVRNNREFDNLNKEIEYQELEIEASQRKIKHYSAELESKLQEKAKTTKDIEEIDNAGLSFDNYNVVLYTGGSVKWITKVPCDCNCVLDMSKEPQSAEAKDSTAGV